MYAKIDLNSFLSDMIESMFPRFSDPSLGLRFIIKLDYEDFGYDESGDINIRESWRKTCLVEMIIQRPSNYTKVLGRVNEQESFETSFIKEQRFQQLSNHDSCWRHDGFSILNDTISTIYDSYKKDRPGESVKNLSEHIGFSLISGGPTFVKFEKIERHNIENKFVADYIVKIEKKLSIKEAGSLMPE